MLNWIECNNWDDLPVGEFIVRLDKDRSSHHAARRSEDGLIKVGHTFHFDHKGLIAYAEFNKYGE